MLNGTIIIKITVKIMVYDIIIRRNGVNECYENYAFMS